MLHRPVGRWGDRSPFCSFFSTQLSCRFCFASGGDARPGWGWWCAPPTRTCASSSGIACTSCSQEGTTCTAHLEIGTSCGCRECCVGCGCAFEESANGSRSPNPLLIRLVCVFRNTYCWIFSDGYAVLGDEEVVSKFGVKPSALPDLFGLVGDVADNIPGEMLFPRLLCAGDLLRGSFLQDIFPVSRTPPSGCCTPWLIESSKYSQTFRYTLSPVSRICITLPGPPFHFCTADSEGKFKLSCS